MSSLDLFLNRENSVCSCRAASIKLGHVDSVKKAEETRIDIKTPTRVRARPRKVMTKQKARPDDYLEEVAV